MHSSVNVNTQSIPRKVLAEMAGNHRLIKLLENLVSDVTGSLPDGIDAIEDAAESSRALAQLALGLAEAARVLANSANEGPPRAEIVLPDIPQDTYALLSALRDRVAELDRAVAQLKEGPTP